MSVTETSAMSICASISTDIELDETEIIRIYGKRWDIEDFFKVCKSYLHLSKECRCISYEGVSQSLCKPSN